MEDEKKEILEVTQPQPKKTFDFHVRRKTVICVILFVVFTIAAFAVGMAIGSATIGSSMSKKRMEKMVKMAMATKYRLKAHEDIVSSLKASNLRENLRYFSMKPHTAAMSRNNELGEEIHRRFQSYGFKSKKESYNVLLSYPRKDKPNYAHIINESGKPVYTTQKIESVLEPNEKSSDAIQPFNAYSPAGTIEGDLVYVNYGRYEDFKELKEKYNVSCKGKIVIVRYGKLFRGDKVNNAEKNGAIGVLIYNDPGNFGPVPDNQLFPNSVWLSRDGVERGSILKRKGDPLTPGYPSMDKAHRVNTPDLPKIPSHPISAKDALQFMSKMGGQAVKDMKWKGGLPITYRVGPGFTGNSSKWKVKIEIHNEQKRMNITNVIGTLKGAVEPDRYVMIGNHRDAWVFGAVDASSGTSVMMEIARAIGKKVKAGWRPRRTIIFCSWDGEEHSIIGSSEWVEQHSKLLRDRGVAYFNIDSAISGNKSLMAAASPLMYKTLIKASSKTKDPSGSMTVLQRYVKEIPSRERPGEPLIRNLGSGSDYVKFYQLIGVTSIDLGYGGNYGVFYPVYHTLHDTFYWMTKFVDPEFKLHLVTSRVIARALLDVADSPLLPWNAMDYAKELKSGAEKLKKVLAKNDAVRFTVKTDYLESAVEKFAKAAADLHQQLKSKRMSDPMMLRMINDRLMQLEKGFILPEGLPGRPDIKHLIYAPSLYNSYGSTLFCGVSDQLFDIKNNPDKWETVKIQLTILASRIESVAETLVGDM